MKIAGPVIREKFSDCFRGEDNRREMIARTKAFEEHVRQREDVIFALAKWGDKEPHGGETKGQFVEELVLACKISEVRFTRGDDRKPAGSAKVEVFQSSKQKSLSRRTEQIDAIEVYEAGQRPRIDLEEEPIACVVSGESVLSNFGVPGEEPLIKEPRHGVFACAALALDGGDAEMRGDDADLIEQLAHGATGDYEIAVSVFNELMFLDFAPQFGSGDDVCGHSGPLMRRRGKALAAALGSSAEMRHV
jgi:hypothetical protein